MGLRVGVCLVFCFVLFCVAAFPSAGDDADSTTSNQPQDQSNLQKDLEFLDSSTPTDETTSTAATTAATTAIKESFQDQDLQPDVPEGEGTNNDNEENLDAGDVDDQAETRDNSDYDLKGVEENLRKVLPSGSQLHDLEEERIKQLGPAASPNGNIYGNFVRNKRMHIGRSRGRGINLNIAVSGNGPARVSTSSLGASTLLPEPSSQQQQQVVSRQNPNPPPVQPQQQLKESSSTAGKEKAAIDDNKKVPETNTDKDNKDAKRLPGSDAFPESSLDGTTDSEKCVVQRVTSECFTIECHVPTWILEDPNAQCRAIAEKRKGVPDERFPMVQIFPPEQLHQLSESGAILEHTFKDVEAGAEYATGLVCQTSRGEFGLYDRDTGLPLAVQTLEDKRTLQVCPEEGEVELQTSIAAQATHITFKNNANQEIIAYRVQPDGSELSWRSLAPKTEAKLKTFISHLWRVRASSDGKLLLSTKVTARNNRFPVQDCHQFQSACQQMRPEDLKEGFLETGYQLHYDRSMTVEKAQSYCCLHKDCYGFTFQAESSKTTSPVKVWFKKAGVGFQTRRGWYSFIKSNKTSEVSKRFYLGAFQTNIPASAENQNSSQTAQNIKAAMIRCPLRKIEISGSIPAEEGGFNEFNPDASDDHAISQAGISSHATSQSVLVSSATSQVTIKVVELDSGASVRINGEEVASGSLSKPILVSSKQPSVVEVVVVASSSAYQRTFPIVIQRDETFTNNDIFESIGVGIGSIVSNFATYVGDQPTISTEVLTELLGVRGLDHDTARAITTVVDSDANGIVNLREFAIAARSGLIPMSQSENILNSSAVAVPKGATDLFNNVNTGKEYSWDVVGDSVSGRLVNYLESVSLSRSQAALAVSQSANVRVRGSDTALISLRFIDGVAEQLPTDYLEYSFYAGVVSGVVPHKSQLFALSNLDESSRLFQILDIDGNGHVSKEEASKAKKRLGGSESSKIFAKVLTEGFQDNDQEVSLQKIVTASRLLLLPPTAHHAYRIHTCVGLFDTVLEWSGSSTDKSSNNKAQSGSLDDSLERYLPELDAEEDVGSDSNTPHSYDQNNSTLARSVPISGIVSVLEGRGWDREVAAFIARDIAPPNTNADTGRVTFGSFVNACEKGALPLFGIHARAPRGEHSVLGMLSALAATYSQNGPPTSTDIRGIVQPIISHHVSRAFEPQGEWAFMALLEAAKLQGRDMSDQQTEVDLGVVFRIIFETMFSGPAHRANLISVSDDLEQFAATANRFHDLDVQFRDSLAVADVIDHLKILGFSDQDSATLASAADHNGDEQVDLFEFSIASKNGLMPTWGRGSSYRTSGILEHSHLIFGILDSNDDGSLTKNELMGPLTHSGLSLPEAAAVVAAVFPAGGNNLVSFKNFISAVIFGAIPLQNLESGFRSRLPTEPIPELLNSEFSLYDSNGDGYISRTELSRKFQQIAKLEPAEANLLADAALNVQTKDTATKPTLTKYSFIVAVAQGLIPLEAQKSAIAKQQLKQHARNTTKPLTLLKDLKISNLGEEITKFDPAGRVVYEVLLLAGHNSFEIIPVAVDRAATQILVDDEEIHSGEPSRTHEVPENSPAALYVTAASKSGEGASMRYVVLVHQYSSLAVCPAGTKC